MPFRLSTVQTIAVGAASVAVASPFGVQTQEVRVISTTACHIVFDTTPVATTSDTYVAANREEIFRVTRGQKIAAIQNAAGGTLYVTELTR